MQRSHLSICTILWLHVSLPSVWSEVEQCIIMSLSCTVHASRATNWRANMVAPSLPPHAYVSGPDAACHRSTASTRSPSPGIRAASRLTSSSLARSHPNPPHSKNMCNHCVCLATDQSQIYHACDASSQCMILCLLLFPMAMMHMRVVHSYCLCVRVCCLACFAHCKSYAWQTDTSHVKGSSSSICPAMKNSVHESTLQDHH